MEEYLEGEREEGRVEERKRGREERRKEGRKGGRERGWVREGRKVNGHHQRPFQLISLYTAHICW